MGVYFGETEITNIDNLAPAQGQDITQAFFGSTEVFTVWGEYDGTLPAQYSANGNYLADYRIYGAVGGVGDEVPNLWDAEFEQGVFTNAAAEGTIYENMKQPSSTRIRTKNIVKINGNCTLFVNEPYRLFICFFDENMQYKTSATYAPGYIGWLVNPLVFPYGDIAGVPEYIAVAVSRIDGGNILPSDDIQIVLNAGSTPIPYGYEVDMSVSDGTTTTTIPIYIGGEPLGEDEYVSFKEQKIYRMSGDVLTPTDPPVPLPALPAVNGVNIVDYAGQSAVPSRFTAKYRKEGF